MMYNNICALDADFKLAELKLPIGNLTFSTNLIEHVFIHDFMTRSFKVQATANITTDLQHVLQQIVFNLNASIDL